MIDLAQDGVSAEHVLEALHFPNGRRCTTMELYALRGGVHLCRLRLLGYELRCESGADVKYTARFTVLDDEKVDWRADLLQPEMTVQVDGRTLRYPFPRMRATKISGLGELRIEAADESVLLANNCVGEALFLPAGTRYVSCIEKMLSGAGFTNTLIEASDAQIACDREDWPAQTPMLTFINDLLGEMGYRSLEADHTGVLRAKKYRTPGGKDAGIVYRTGEGGVVLAGRQRHIDGMIKPNRFIGFVSNPDDGPLRCEVINDDPVSPISAQNNGGFTVTAVREYGHIADLPSLELCVRRWASEVEQEVESVVLWTAPMPHHEVGEMVFLDCPESRGLFFEEGWSIADGVMTHKLRRCSFD